MSKKEDMKKEEVISEAAESVEAELVEEELEGELEEEVDELEEKIEEIAELKKQMLLIKADTENYKKRMAREKADSVQFANEKLIKELVPVYDNLNRALAAPDVSVESLKEGVEMTAKQFSTFLEKQHVTEIPSVGEKFDPSVHEVLSQIETDEHEEGTIIEEYMKGYKIHDRVLIPAKVVIAKQPASSPDEPADEES